MIKEEEKIREEDKRIEINKLKLKVESKINISDKKALVKGKEILAKEKKKKKKEKRGIVKIRPL